MSLKKNLISIGIGLIVSVPVVISALHNQGNYKVDVSAEQLETETFTEHIEIYSASTEATVAPVQPLYDFIPLPADLQVYTCEIAAEYEINPILIFAVMWKESSFKVESLNDNGEYSVGLMQINTYWHRDRMDRLGVTDITDPKQNILVGIDYLAELLNYRNDTTLEWALMAYNGGPTYADEMTAQGKVSEYALKIKDKLLEYAEAEYGSY